MILKISGASPLVLTTLLAMTPTPAHALADPLVSLAGTQWRTSTGHELEAAATNLQTLLFSGGNPGDAADREALDLRPTAQPSRRAGHWMLYRGGSQIDGGEPDVEMSATQIKGAIRDTHAGTRPFMACRISSDSGKEPRFLESWLWVGHDPFYRDGISGGILVTLVLQNVSTSDRVLSLDRLSGQFRGDSFTTYNSPNVHLANRAVASGMRAMAPCQEQRVNLLFPDAVAESGGLVEVRLDGREVATWRLDVKPPVKPTPMDPAPPPPPPIPAPTPAPSQAPPPGPTPPPMPTPTPAPSGPSFSGWQQYGPNWSFKVDDFVQGPDGDWQALVSVRSETRDRVGFVASEIEAYLLNADGESRRNVGNLYRASSGGAGQALERLTGTQWMQKGDVLRVRLLWEGTRNLRPTQLRLKNSGGSPHVQTFPLN